MITPCRLSAIAYSIYSQLPSISEAVPPSATWWRAMTWWQGPTNTDSTYPAHLILLDSITRIIFLLHYLVFFHDFIICHGQPLCSRWTDVQVYSANKLRYEHSDSNSDTFNQIGVVALGVRGWRGNTAIYCVEMFRVCFVVTPASAVCEQKDVDVADCMQRFKVNRRM